MFSSIPCKVLDAKPPVMTDIALPKLSLEPYAVFIPHVLDDLSAAPVGGVAKPTDIFPLGTHPGNAAHR